MARGVKSKYPPEIYDLCLELQVTKAWGPVKIAEYLFHEKGVTHKDDPSRPVRRETIWKWIRKSAKQVHEEKVYDNPVETVKANVTLDDIKKRLYELPDRYPDLTFEEELKWIDRALQLQREKSTTNGVYPERRKKVVHGGEVEVKGVSPKDLDPKREFDLSDFERWIANGKEPAAEHDGS